MAAAQKDVGSLLQDLGGALRDSGDHAGAATAFLQATGLLWEAGEESSSDRALDSLGNALKKLRRFSPAEIVRAAQGYPGDAVAMMDLSIAARVLGFCLCKARRYDEAIKAARQAQKIFEARGESWEAGLARGMVAPGCTVSEGANSVLLDELCCNA